MKSFTSVEQSKKLAEILPLESADMFWMKDSKDFYEVVAISYSESGADKDDGLPCWSLAALIGIIPQEIFDDEYIINITEGIDNKWIITYDHYENRNNSYYSLSTGADNLVDACYEMILKLNELNLL